ncbi:MAG: DUF4411 family protein [Chloroflexi bacterium]|nr:DUF4411 family protein [Chloroflexota bacterium]
MVDYWLDSNSLITPKKGPYGFDIAPGFWTLLEQKASEGVIRSPRSVYYELVDMTDDDLADWAKERKEGELFVEPDEAVQGTFRTIADYVQDNYDESNARHFLDGADPWVIAHAKTRGGEVVTFEVRAPNSRKVKIPDVCDRFGLECTDTYKMVRSLGASLELR